MHNTIKCTFVKDLDILGKMNVNIYSEPNHPSVNFSCFMEHFSMVKQEK